MRVQKVEIFRKWRFFKRNAELIGIVALFVIVIAGIIIGLSRSGKFIFSIPQGIGTSKPFQLQISDHYYDSGPKPLVNNMSDTKSPSYELNTETPLTVGASGNLEGLFRMEGKVYVEF